MRNSLRTLLFISALSPALLTMAYVRYDLKGLNEEIYQLAIVGLLGSLLPILIIKLVRRTGEVFAIHVKKIESNDFLLIAFVVSYLLPFVMKGADMSISSIFIFIIAVGIVLWLVSSIPAHPILRVLRFKFYKLELSNGMVYTLISRRNIRDPKEIKAVRKISENMLMEGD